MLTCNLGPGVLKKNSDLQQSCKTSTKNSQMPFTHIPQMLAFYHIYITFFPLRCLKVADKMSFFFSLKTSVYIF